MGPTQPSLALLGVSFEDDMVYWWPQDKFWDAALRSSLDLLALASCLMLIAIKLNWSVNLVPIPMFHVVLLKPYKHQHAHLQQYNSLTG